MATSLNLLEYILPLIKKNYCFLTIDPGTSDIGWCICSIHPYAIITTGSFNYKKHINKYNNDDRVAKIYSSIEALIVKYQPAFVCVEQMNYSSGRFSFAENSLNKSVGTIHSSILREGIPLVEIGNKQAQKIVLGKSERTSNKKGIKLFVIDNLLCPGRKLRLNKDIYDAIFLAYAIYKLYQDILVLYK